MKKILFYNLNGYDKDYQTIIPIHSKPISIISDGNEGYVLCVELDPIYDEYHTKTVFLKKLSPYSQGEHIEKCFIFLGTVKTTTISPYATTDMGSFTINMNNINNEWVFYINENLQLEETRNKKLKNLNIEES